LPFSKWHIDFVQNENLGDDGEELCETHDHGHRRHSNRGISADPGSAESGPSGGDYVGNGGEYHHESRADESYGESGEAGGQLSSVLQRGASKFHSKK
jgi:hypothetical protein